MQLGCHLATSGHHSDKNLGMWGPLGESWCTMFANMGTFFWPLGCHWPPFDHHSKKTKCRGMLTSKPHCLWGPSIGVFFTRILIKTGSGRPFGGVGPSRHAKLEARSRRSSYSNPSQIACSRWAMEPTKKPATGCPGVANAPVPKSNSSPKSPKSAFKQRSQENVYSQIL